MGRLILALALLCSCASFRDGLRKVSNTVATASDSAGDSILRGLCEREMEAIGRTGTLQGGRCTESGPGAGTPATDEQLAELRRVRDRWRPVREAHEVLAQAQRAMAAALSTADDAAAYQLLSAVGRLVEAYNAVRAAARALGTDLPNLPNLR